MSELKHTNSESSLKISRSLPVLKEWISKIEYRLVKEEGFNWVNGTLTPPENYIHPNERGRILRKELRGIVIPID